LTIQSADAPTQFGTTQRLLATLAPEQWDAREVGLARVFEMENRWFRLGDPGRYVASQV
jgi:hypothetical protein